MTKTLLTHCAAVAIAASAAFPATAAIAQDTSSSQPAIVPSEPPPMPMKPVANPAPSSTLPATGGSAAPAPGPIVLPLADASASKVPAIAPDAVQPVDPATPVPAVDMARERAASTKASTRSVKPSAPVATHASTGVPAASGDASNIFVAPVARPSTSPGLQASNTGRVTRSNQISDNQISDSLIAGIAGALGLLIVGGLGFIALRRRRNAPPYVEGAGHRSQPIPPGPVQPQPGKTHGGYSIPATATIAASAAAGLANRIAPPIADAGHARHPLAKVQSAPATRNDPVALPPAVPESFEERDALLKRLIAARPDRANPFRSRRARAHRAKLIIQSLDRSFERTKPRIDLSQYSDRWPALRGWRPATA